MNIKPSHQKQMDAIQHSSIESHPITSWLAAFRIKSVVWFNVVFAPSYGSGNYHDRIKRVVADKFRNDAITRETLRWFDKDTVAYALTPEYRKTRNKISMLTKERL